jgi:hypothetical protein
MSRWDLPVPESPIRHSGWPLRIQSQLARVLTSAGLMAGLASKSKLVAGHVGYRQVERHLIGGPGEQAGLLAAGTAHARIHGQIAPARGARRHRVGAGEAAAGLAEPLSESPLGLAWGLTSWTASPNRRAPC